MKRLLIVVLISTSAMGQALLGVSATKFSRLSPHHHIPLDGLVFATDFSDDPTKAYINNIAGPGKFALIWNYSVVNGAYTVPNPWGLNGFQMGTSASVGLGVPLLANTDMTVLVLAKQSPDGRNYVPIFANENATGWQFSVDIAGSARQGYYSVGGPGWIQGSANVQDGLWHVIGMTIQGTNVKFYLDGLPDGGVQTSIQPSAWAGPASIGAIWTSPTTTGNAPVGYFSYILQYNFARSAADVLWISNLLLQPSYRVKWNTPLPSNQTPDLTPLSPDGQASVPYLGWNSGYGTSDYAGWTITEAQFKAQTDAMSTKLASSGYQYVWLDASGFGRDSGGNFVLNPTQFPDGGAAMGTYVHSKGLKFGMYASPGSVDCAQGQGSALSEFQDAATFAAWGVDLLKYDYCSGDSFYAGYFGGNVQNTQEWVYKRMATALRSTGRSILFNICQYGFNNVDGWAANMGGHSWRVSSDGGKSYSSSVDLMFDIANTSYPYAGPGHWPDFDNLIIGNGTASTTEGQSAMALWSMGASPLVLQADLTALSGADLATATNADAIAIDQDTLGQAGRRISATACGGSYCEVWARQLSGTNRWAIALFNRDSASHSITATWAAITAVFPGFGGAYTTTKDIFLGTSPGTLNTSYTPAAIPSHGVTWVRLAP